MIRKQCAEYCSLQKEGEDNGEDNALRKGKCEDNGEDNALRKGRMRR